MQYVLAHECERVHTDVSERKDFTETGLLWMRQPEHKDMILGTKLG